MDKPSEISSFSARTQDVGLEDGEMRGPLSGLFRGLQMVSFNEATRELILKFPNFQQLCDMAKKKAAKVKDYPQLSIDMKASIVLYSMEDYPPEISPYSVLNRALREKDRDSVKPWRLYIWLFLNALKAQEASQIATVFRGCKVNAESLGDQCKVGEQSVWSAFSSTATTVDVMQSFLGTNGPRTLFSLQLLPGFGRSITDFSFFPNENEVVLPPNIEFEVVSKVDLGNGLTMVQLHQIESSDAIMNFGAENEKSVHEANRPAIPPPAVPPPAVPPPAVPPPAIFDSSQAYSGITGSVSLNKEGLLAVSKGIGGSVGIVGKPWQPDGKTTLQLTISVVKIGWQTAVGVVSEGISLKKVWVPHREKKYMAMALRSTGQYLQRGKEVSVTGLLKSTICNGDIVRMEISCEGQISFSIKRGQAAFRGLNGCNFLCTGSFTPYVALAKDTVVQLIDYTCGSDQPST